MHIVILNNMLTATQKARAFRAAEICKSHGITQSQIASALGASQSQVSRVLNAQGLRPSRLFEEVCLYVERFEGGISLEQVRANEELMTALQSTWDGSAAHARALAEVIKSLAVLHTREREATSQPEKGR